MDYKDLTKEQLIEIINDYQLLNHQLISEVDQNTGLDFSSNGNLGHWYLNLRSEILTGNPMKFRAMGYTDREILQSVAYQNFLSKIHPADVQKITDTLSTLIKGDTIEYKAEYRIRGERGSYEWFYDRGRITQYDEIGKPLLLSGITYDITSVKDSSVDYKYYNTDLPEQTFIDTLTKIKNRRSLVKDLSTLIELAQQNRNPFVLSLLDIDNFKEVNDKKGYLYGNKVLIDIADLIRRNITENVVFGRYSGDQFMIIFMRTKPEDTIDVLERIRRTVERYGFPDYVKITVSGGVKEFQGEELPELINKVEMKLTHAKNNGKNQIA